MNLKLIFYFNYKINYLKKNLIINIKKILTMFNKIAFLNRKNNSKRIKFKKKVLL